MAYNGRRAKRITLTSFYALANVVKNHVFLAGNARPHSPLLPLLSQLPQRLPGHEISFDLLKRNALGFRHQP